MTLTELRSRLEELEGKGYGGRSVGVIPAPPSVDGWSKAITNDKNRFRLNFIVMDYVVCDVSMPTGKLVGSTASP